MARVSRRIWGWWFFDWASQPYSTLLLTFIFAPYMAQVIGDGTTAQVVWGYGNSAAGIAIAVLSPLLGAVADRTGGRIRFIVLFSVIQTFAADLSASKHGSVINIASIHASLGPDWSLYEGTEMAHPAAYAASKGGLVQITRWLATTLAPDVRVNSISPGGVERGQPEAFVERYNGRTPLRRMAVPSDIKGAIAFLASDLSAYVTGHDLVVDGGYSIW